MPHFDAKGESDRYFIESGVPATLLLTSFYWDNFIYFGMGPRKGPDGHVVHHGQYSGADGGRINARIAAAL